MQIWRLRLFFVVEALQEWHGMTKTVGRRSSKRRTTTTTTTTRAAATATATAVQKQHHFVIITIINISSLLQSSAAAIPDHHWPSITWISLTAQNPSMSLQSLNENGSQVLSRIWSCIRGDEEANGIGFAIGVDLCGPQSRIIHNKSHNVCKPQRMKLCNNKDKSTIDPPFLDGYHLFMEYLGCFCWSPTLSYLNGDQGMAGC